MAGPEPDGGRGDAVMSGDVEHVLRGIPVSDVTPPG